MSSRHDVILIGGGHNGLVAGCYLNRSGTDVLVIAAGAALGAEGDAILLWRDARRAAEEIRRYSKAHGDAYLDLVRRLDAALERGLPRLMTNPRRPDIRAITGGPAGPEGNERPKELVRFGTIALVS